MAFSLDFSHAFGAPKNTATFRQLNEDFQVVEVLGFELAGEGEHLYLQVKKDGENTGWVAEQLALLFDVKLMDVGFAGLKDRHAVTTQWFSIYVPKARREQTETKLQAGLVGEPFQNCQLLNTGWHQQKLRRGMHAANRFNIRLRDLSDSEELVNRIEKTKHGVPNYFGEQRFGIAGGNLTLAEKWFAEGETIRKKKIKGMVMSAARSYLFNRVLDARVRQNNWNTRAFDETGDSTGPLWGRGNSSAPEQLKTFEADILEPQNHWLDGLEHCGLSQERRPLILLPVGLTVDVIDDVCELSFELMPGCYATSVLRELSVLNNAREIRS